MLFGEVFYGASFLYSLEVLCMTKIFYYQWFGLTRNLESILNQSMECT